MIAVIDYGAGNLRSIRMALQRAGAVVEVTADPQVVTRAAGVVLPGVGAAGPAMRRLAGAGLDEAVRQVVRLDTPLLGVCLGLQLLFEQNEEGDVQGLGMLPGSVRRLPDDLKVPHMGWNQVEAQAETALLAGIAPSSYFYFVHSYYVEPRDPAIVVARTSYGRSFCSAIATGRVWGTQFHPEKSGEVGLRLLRNFVRLCESC